MKLVNQIVRHDIFGEGIVSSLDGTLMLVRFEDVEKRFQYPLAFEKFLTAVDPAIAELINAELRDTVEKSRKAIATVLPVVRKAVLPEARNRGAAPRPRQSGVPNIAIKCNFNDGGSDINGIGFLGVCSDEVIQYNVETGNKSWCSSPECACYQYLCDEIDRNELDLTCEDGGYACYESQILRDWTIMSGVYQTGPREGMAMHFRQVNVNKLCVLTTIDPDSCAEDRYIFAVFIIGAFYKGNDTIEDKIIADKVLRLSLQHEQAITMRYWNYHRNKNKSEELRWSSGLHRYIDDLEAIRILDDVVQLTKETPDEEIAMRIRTYFCEKNGIDQN